MPDLEHDLARLSADLDWPADPDLAEAVTARLAAAGARPPARRLRAPRRVVLVVCAALLVLPAAAVGLPGARDAVLEWLGLRHVAVERRPAPPHGATPAQGTRLPLREAARRAGLTPLIPPRFAGAPAFLDGDVLVLRSGGLLLEQRRGRLDRVVLRKILGATGIAQPATVRGARALFFPEAHAYLWVTPGGDIREAPPLRSGPSLVWEHGGVVLRLEGPRLTRRGALRIARAARPAAGGGGG